MRRKIIAKPASDSGGPRLSRWVCDATLGPIPHMAWTYDAFGKLNYVNTAWIRYTGLSLSDSVAQQQPIMWDHLLAPGQYEDFVKSLNSTMTNGKAFYQEVRLSHSREVGDFRWYAVSVSPSFAAEGTIRSWVGMAVDIEDRKQAEWPTTIILAG